MIATMCGIIGYIGDKPVVPVLIEGLRRLEYRGYDSAGVAVVNGHGIDIRRSAGKLANLEHVIAEEPISGLYGLGHTRWATHGRPTEENAHPHRDCTGRIVVVHNGIIENYLELKQELQSAGPQVRHRNRHRSRRAPGRAGMEGRRPRTRGAAGDAAAARTVCHRAALGRRPRKDRRGAQRAAGRRRARRRRVVRRVGHSRHPAAHPRRRVSRRPGNRDRDARRRAVHEPCRRDRSRRSRQRVTWDPVQAEKAGYKHFMLKEIFEQPTAVRETILGRVSQDTGPRLPRRDDAHRRRLPRHRQGAVLLACGTSWHAALVGKFLIEQLAEVPTEVDYGSEFRYRSPIVDERTLTVVITQSGETADTLAALREAKAQRLAQPRDLQRRRQHGDARGRGHALHARRPGDRRGVDQGVHVPARRAAPAGDVSGPGARHARRRPIGARHIDDLLQPAESPRTGAEDCPSRSRRSRRASTTAPISCISAAASTTRSRSKAR